MSNSTQSHLQTHGCTDFKDITDELADERPSLGVRNDGRDLRGLSVCLSGQSRFTQLACRHEMHASSTRDQKLTLIYRTLPTTDKWKTEKNKK